MERTPRNIEMVSGVPKERGKFVIVMHISSLMPSREEVLDGFLTSAIP
jgi:hypothetical protein